MRRDGMKSYETAEHQTTNLGVRGSNPFGRAIFLLSRAQLGRRERNRRSLVSALDSG
jgi:hypothetical protein